MTKETFLEERLTLNMIIHDIVAEMDGSISAEHGVGLLKRDDMIRYKPQVMINLMRQIKESLDPNNIMNPGKVLPIANGSINT